MKFIEVRRTSVLLKAAINEIKMLNELLPICAGCKKIRDDNGYWSNVEKYISTHTHTGFTHGICPDCMLITNLYGML